MNDPDKKLDALARSLPEARAEFGVEDILVRAGTQARPRSWWNWSAAAAAVLLLAVTHAAAFFFGIHRAEPEVRTDAISESEEILRELATLDATAPHDQLRPQLDQINDELQRGNLVHRLADAPSDLREGMKMIVQTMGNVEDPGFRAITLRAIANTALKGEVKIMMIPSTAENYQRITKLEDDKYMVLVVQDGRVHRQEFTEEQLTAQGLAVPPQGEER